MSYDQRNDTTTCPECGSEHIDCGSITVEGGSCYQVCECNMCWFSWTDIYRFEGHINHATEEIVYRKNED